jgi:hypothetical protein
MVSGRSAWVLDCSVFTWSLVIPVPGDRGGCRAMCEHHLHRFSACSFSCEAGLSLCPVVPGITRVWCRSFGPCRCR